MALGRSQFSDLLLMYSLSNAQKAGWPHHWQKGAGAMEGLASSTLMWNTLERWCKKQSNSHRSFNHHCHQKFLKTISIVNVFLTYKMFLFPRSRFPKSCVGLRPTHSMLASSFFSHVVFIHQHGFAKPLVELGSSLEGTSTNSLRVAQPNCNFSAKSDRARRFLGVCISSEFKVDLPFTSHWAVIADVILAFKIATAKGHEWDGSMVFVTQTFGGAPLRYSRHCPPMKPSHEAMTIWVPVFVLHFKLHSGLLDLHNLSYCLFCLPNDRLSNLKTIGYQNRSFVQHSCQLIRCLFPGPQKILQNIQSSNQPFPIQIKWGTPIEQCQKPSRNPWISW